MTFHILLSVLAVASRATVATLIERDASMLPLT